MFEIGDQVVLRDKWVKPKSHSGLYNTVFTVVGFTKYTNLMPTVLVRSWSNPDKNMFFSEDMLRFAEKVVDV